MIDIWHAMVNRFDNLLQLSKVKELCFFCRSPMQALLTSFMEPPRRGISTLNVPIKDEKFSFDINHTTESYSVQGKALIDLKTNVFSFVPSAISPTPFADFHLACEAFRGFDPHMEIACLNKKCKREYHLCSNIFWMFFDTDLTNIDRRLDTVGRISTAINVVYESFRIDNFIVQNNIDRKLTSIYSRSNENVEPLVVMPMLDFEKLGSKKLLTRIKTLVVWT